ncbi:MAG: hypothetical protein HGB12_06225 [Bacteroidetes bacterium]|nr:hypothetical protein [Bacteroidota bacterium]
MKNLYYYLILGVLFLVSLASVSYLPGNEISKIISSLPAFGAVIAALFKLLSEQLQHDRIASLQAAQQSFALGTTSHMATVAFDKHVLFVEEYISEMLKTLSTLFKNGPDKIVLKHQNNLSQIRQKSAAWLTIEIDNELEKFEAVLHKIGTSAFALEVNHESSNRQDAIDKMYRLFSDVIEMDNNNLTKVNSQWAIASIINKLRQILGINELTELRKKLINQSLSN